MPEIEVYTTGGGYYLWDLFNFLAMFTGNGGWMEMLTIGIILGVIWQVAKFALSGSFQGTWQYLVLLATVGALGVGPKARVIILDSTYPLNVYGVVDNVPYSVALVAGLTSKTSHTLTRRMETLLATPNNLTYQQNGMIVGSSLMAQAARWRAVTPTIQTNLVNFMENCMIDGANIGLVDIDALAHARNVQGFINAQVPGALAYYDETLDQTVRCTDGWANLQSTVNDEVDNVLFAKAAGLAPADRFGNRNSFDPNQLRGSLEDWQTMMAMASTNATAYIRQSMLITALDDASGRLIANSGNSAAMELYQRARADAQTRSSYQIIGSSATKWVPILKITFEALYLGAFPLAMLLMMTPLAATVARGYFGGFVWLAAWEPMSAILHTTVMKSATGWYRDSMATVYGGGTVENALTWANHLGVHAVEGDVGTVAGYLMMSVPFLSFAVLFGAQKMAGLATSMLNVSQGAAIETGREAATGNVSLGNTSMNNMRANQYLQSSMMDTGRSSLYLNDGGMVTTNRDGSTTYQAGSAQSNVGMSAMIGQTVREEVSDRASEAWRSSQSHQEDMVNSLTATSSQLSEYARSASYNRTAGNERGWSGTEEQRRQANTTWEGVQQLAETHGLSTDIAISAALAANLGTPPAQVSAALQASGRLNASSSEAFEMAYRDAKTSGLSDSVGMTITSSDRAYAGGASSEGESGTNSMRSNYDNLQSESRRYTTAVEQAQTLDRANAWLQSKDYSYNQRITDAVISELEQQGYSQDQISSLVNPKTTAGIRRQEEVVGSMLPGIIEELGISNGSNFTPPPMQGGYYNSGNVVATSVDPSTAPVTTPNVGYYGQSHAQTESAANQNFDVVNDKLTAAERTRSSNVESRLAAGANEVDRMVGGAFVDRAVGVVGVDPVFSDMPSPGAQPSSPPAQSPPPPSQPPSVPQRGPSQASYSASALNRELSPYEKDVMVRTIIGEAANEGVIGQAAVAHTIRNRVMDQRWGDDPAEVSLQFKQFSAWNDGAGGNSLPTKYNPGDALYDRVAGIVDDVWNGNTRDMTGGATFYYSPAGMNALVAEGSQSNHLPNWLAQENADRGAPPAHIGGHIFTGRVQN